MSQPLERKVNIEEMVGQYIDGSAPDQTILLYDIAESLQKIIRQLDILIVRD